MEIKKKIKIISWTGLIISLSSFFGWWIFQKTFIGTTVVSIILFAYVIHVINLEIK